MDVEERFDLIFSVGRRICASYTGFSKTEVRFCQSKNNWMCVRDFMLSEDPYEALISMSFNPLLNVVNFFQLFVGCMMQFPEEDENKRLANLLAIIDDNIELDNIVSNSKIIRAILALAAKYQKNNPNYCFKIFFNAKRILAHIMKKFPDYMKLNVLRTNKKSKSLRFKPEEISSFF